MELQVHRLREHARLPEFAHDDDAGMDLFVAEETTVPARGRAVVHTGIAMVFPKEYVALIWDKSGLANHHGLTTIAGVFDAGYRGEYNIVITNTTDEDYVFARGDKVAQVLIQKIEHPHLTVIDDLPESERGSGGFGSTGK